MSFFAAPSWDVDESNQKLSSDIFRENASPSKGGKDHRKNKGSLNGKATLQFRVPKSSPNNVMVKNRTSPSHTPNATHSGPQSAPKKQNVAKDNKNPIFKALTKKQRRALKIKLKKQQLTVHDSNTPNQLESGIPNSEEQREQTSPKKKSKAKSKEKTDIEIEDRLQDKFGKLLKFHLKKQKAQKTKANLNSLILSNQISTSVVNPSVPLEKKLKMKLKKKERMRRRRDSLGEEEEIKKTEVSSSNEVVLSRSKRRRMRVAARKASEVTLEKLSIDSKGTSNPSFDISLSEGHINVTIDTNHQTNAINGDRKKKRIKKKATQNDSVDGNLVSSSAQSMLKKDVVPYIAESDSFMKESKKKRLTIAKLLQESAIKDKTTLQDLKKKRRQLMEGTGPGKKFKETPLPLKERMAEQLKSARFRWLNEQLYTSNSWEALNFFKEDPEAYEAYHSGYRNQVAQWPLNPVDVIIKAISSFPTETVVADFGCGDAKLAKSLPNFKVHSLDLVASQPGVVACDMAHTPLLMESVDVAVFCLSLMGTNLNDFALEANRVLKTGGMLMIAEVESRFEDIDNFTSAMSQFGFQLKKKDLSHQMFIFIDFKKVKKATKSGKLPVLALEACVYKKR